MKILLQLLVMLAFSANLLVAQTIVGTDPENKNVVLEEFTGIHCVFCPDGHAIAQGIYDTNPEDVVLINVHTGSFAAPNAGEPDFRTPWGPALEGQSNLQGYPAGTVNRHYWEAYNQGGGTAQGRNTWTTTSNQILNQPSYLNIELESTIVTSTRQLVVYVEVYYTGDSPEETNLLNIAVLQNNINGPQTGGGAGSNYNHMHMLRHLVTGQWGVTISETTEGSLYTGTFTYELPMDYNDVELVLEDLDIVGFVSETHQEVISGNISELNFMESNENDAAIYSAFVPQIACTEEYAPQVMLKNYGTNNLTSLEFSYTANGEDPATYSWTGNLAQNESEIVYLPAQAYLPTDMNDFSIICELPNGESDELPQNNVYTTTSPGSITFPEDCYLGINISGNPEDITWDLKDESGEVVAEGGPYTSTGFKLAQITFPATGCYSFTLNDASGQGLSGGTYVVADINTNILFTGGPFDYRAVAEFAYDIVIEVPENATNESVNIYPNPITHSANIEFELFENADVKVAVFDMLGRNVSWVYEGEMTSGKQKLQMDATGLNKGIYFVRIQIQNEVYTHKVSIR